MAKKIAQSCAVQVADPCTRREREPPLPREQERKDRVLPRPHVFEEPLLPLEGLTPHKQAAGCAMLDRTAPVGQPVRELE